MSALLKIGGPDSLHNRPRGESVPKAYGSMLTDASTKRWRGWGLFVGLTGVFVIAALWSPPDEPQVVLCPFRALTNYPCPGCGMTRAFCALAHGEFWRAIKFNALSPLLFLAALGAWAYGAAIVLRAERARSYLARQLKPSPFFSKLMLALALAWWIARLVGNF